MYDDIFLCFYHKSYRIQHYQNILFVLKKLFVLFARAYVRSQHFLADARYINNKTNTNH